MFSSSFKICQTVRSGKLAAFLLALVFFAAGSSTAFAKEELPEVSSDGLHLVKGTKAKIVYAKPGLSLAPYTKVQLLDCFVEFKKNWQRDYNLNEIGLDGRISDKDADAIKQRLADEFRLIFTQELAKTGHEVVTEAAPDVLLLRPAILNLDVAAPDVMRAGRSTTWVSEAGAMTLYLELYDSATSELLARVVDPRTADDFGYAQRASRVTNKAEADRILRMWASTLATHLGEVSQP